MLMDVEGCRLQDVVFRSGSANDPDVSEAEGPSVQIEGVINTNADAPPLNNWQSIAEFVILTFGWALILLLCISVLRSVF